MFQNFPQSPRKNNLPVARFARLGVMLALLGSGFACSLGNSSTVDQAVQLTLAAEALLPSATPTSALNPERPTSTQVATLPPAATETLTPEPPTLTPTLANTLSPAEETAIAIASIPPSITPTPLDPNLPARGELKVHDRFDSSGAWIPGDFGASNMQVVGGVMNFQVYKQRALEYRLIGYQMNDFYTQISLEKSTCANGDMAGLLFRLQDPSNFLGVVVNCEQQWRLLKWNAGNLQWLTEWAVHPAIKPIDQNSNVLGAQGRGDTFDIFINDTKIHTFQDNSWASGMFGVFVSSMQSGNFTATFDDMMVYFLP